MSLDAKHYGIIPAERGCGGSIIKPPKAGLFKRAAKVGIMEAKKTNGEEPAIQEKASDSVNEERSLILLEGRQKKKVDETISTPHHYISRYHYETKDLGKYIELCPHCRKPTIQTLRQTVIDTAVDYLYEKDRIRESRGHRRLIFFLFTSLLVLGGGAYYLLFYMISGVRF
jgi:hypothetical protein